MKKVKITIRRFSNDPGIKARYAMVVGFMTRRDFTSRAAAEREAKKWLEAVKTGKVDLTAEIVRE